MVTQRSIGAKDRVETDGQTEGRTDGRGDCITSRAKCGR